MLRCLVDYAALAVGSTGRVTIADVPIENCEFPALVRVLKLDRMMTELAGRGLSNLRLLDLRSFQTTSYPDGSAVSTDLPGDPAGYTEIDLGGNSLFEPLERHRGPQNYYTLGDHLVDHLDPRTRTAGLPNRFHSPGRHAYRIANTILDADLVLSVAKANSASGRSTAGKMSRSPPFQAEDRHA